MKFTRETIRTLRQEAEKALTPIGQHFGLCVRLGGFRFGQHSAEVNVVFSADGATREMTPAAELFLQHATEKGLEPRMLWQTFKTLTGEYQIVGLAPKATKRPVIAIDNKSGYSSRWSVEEVLGRWTVGGEGVEMAERIITDAEGEEDES